MTVEKQIENFDALSSLFGAEDSHIDKLKEAFDAVIIAVGSGIRISGERAAVDDVLSALNAIEKLSKKHPLSASQVDAVIDCVRAGETPDADKLFATVAVMANGGKVRAKTFGQKKYVDAILSTPLVFGVGPAGTGKTYLAVALAVSAFLKGEVSRIILTRPAVEAGEKLGFLPGDLSEKVDPYLRPLFDALGDFLGADAYQKYIERGSIEVAPLAYMRGRTLSDSFIILDEAQNTTPEQMKMFLTRMGQNSRIVVTGDITQIDLPKSQLSGMKHALEVLKDVKGVKIVYLGSRDVVRNEFVARIIEAYDSYEKREREAPQAER